MSLSDLRSFYRTGAEIAVTDLPEGTKRVVARRACGDVEDAALGESARFDGLDRGTYSIEALASDGRLLAEELTTVGAHQGERPVMGFATSFTDDAVEPILTWLNALRCTVVQMYDWMATYSQPLGLEPGWNDPLGRPVSAGALHALAQGVRAAGAVAQAYAPVYAVDHAFAAENPHLLLYRGDGEPERLGDLLEIADPANPEWQRHWIASYGEAAGSVGFDGFHLDTYGYPRAALDAAGAPVDLGTAYASFLQAVRASRPDDVISLNQVNGVPRSFSLPAGPSLRYVEVWPPNRAWRHLESLLDRSSGAVERGGVLACYPPVWDNDRTAALRTVLLTESIATVLGAAVLCFGDREGALSGPYYPRYERLTADEAAQVVRGRRFALRCRDLFLDGEDTSWYEIGDENGAVSVAADAPVQPEPVGGALFARVVRQDNCIAVGIVDLTGSEHGLWSEPTGPGRCRSARVQVLLERPEAWSAGAAVRGAAGDRFTPVRGREVGHREGRALEIEVPLADGWSVLRLVRKREV